MPFGEMASAHHHYSNTVDVTVEAPKDMKRLLQLTHLDKYNMSCEEMILHMPFSAQQVKTSV